MLVTELCKGQGLGNQLWSYVVARTIALDKGFDFGIISPEKFKGSSFLSLDFGVPVRGGVTEDRNPEALPDGITRQYIERDIWHDKYRCDIRDFDPGVLSVSDNTKIAGYFQSEKFILHRRDEIRKWLTVSPAYDCREFSDNDLCVLNIRGGEYKGNPDLILPRKYWTDAIANMLRVNPRMKFMIVTDDVRYAKKLLPEYEAFHFDIGKDYSVVKNAKYLILANSSFSFFPAWTSDTVKCVIAPKYWARHNVSDGFWACAFNLYRDWLWQDREGRLSTFAECENEYARYKAENGVDSFGPKPPERRKHYAERLAQKILDAASRAKHRLLD